LYQTELVRRQHRFGGNLILPAAVGMIVSRPGRSRARELISIQLFNPLNAELNPICHLLALLGAHPIFHVSRVRVNDDLSR